MTVGEREVTTTLDIYDRYRYGLPVTLTVADVEYSGVVESAERDGEFVVVELTEVPEGRLYLWTYSDTPVTVTGPRQETEAWTLREELRAKRNPPPRDGSACTG